MDQKALVERLLDVTQSIKHAVQMADWREATRLMEERAPLFALLTAEQEPAALETIRRVQSIDASIIEEAQAARAELEADYREAMATIEAAKQYHQVASL